MKIKKTLLASSLFLCIITARTILAENQLELTNGQISIAAENGNGEITITTHSGTAICTFTESPLKTEKKTIKSPRWGNGECLVFDDGKHTEYSIALFPGLPFAVISGSVKNNTKKPLYLSEIPLCSLKIMLKNVRNSQIVINGTPGLTSLQPNRKYSSYTYAVLADTDSRRGVVAAWLTDERGSGLVHVFRGEKSYTAAPSLQYGQLLVPPGKTETLETFFLGFFNDVRNGLEKYADAVASYNRIKLPPQPTVYCTWYHLWRGVKEASFLNNVRQAEKLLKPYGMNVMQIDDGWQEGAIRRGTPKKVFLKANKQFPDGMKAVADNVKKLGFIPGIWYMPFSGDADDPFFADKMQIFVKDSRTGKPFNAKWGGNPFDLSNPEAVAYVKNMAETICRKWGYKYIKTDGLWTGMATEQKYISTRYSDDGIGAAKFADPTVTNIQAYRRGLKAVREGAGKDTYILGCNLAQNMRTLPASFGLVDGMRIGPDNAPNYPKILRGPVFGGRFYFLHKRVWHNDPDPIYVRSALDYKTARMLASWVAVTGMLCSTSELYGKLTRERLDLLRRTIPAHNLYARPADFLTNPCPAVWVVKGENAGAERIVIGLFNWGNPEKTVAGEENKDPAAMNRKSQKCPHDITVKPLSPDFKYSLKKIGLDKTVKYVGYEYWSGKFIEPFSGTLETVVPECDCRVFSFRKALSGKAQILGTSRHVTQCLIGLATEKWENNTLAGDTEVIAGESCEIRIAAGIPGNKLKCTEVSVSPEDKAAGVTAAIKEQNGWRLRITLNSPVSRTVKWKAVFEH